MVQQFPAKARGFPVCTTKLIGLDLCNWRGVFPVFHCPAHHQIKQGHTARKSGDTYRSKRVKRHPVYDVVHDLVLSNSLYLERIWEK